MAMTLKQLEALYWIASLGTFERAAVQLNTSQSAISKRIQELEQACGRAVFDRSQRAVRLTEHGEQVMALGHEMLGLQRRILDLRDGGAVPARRLRLGVTELTALTWLPRLVTELRAIYPSITIEPEVELSRHLLERLHEGSIDLIVIPDIVVDPEFTSVALAEVENAWMARPGLVAHEGALSMEDLARYPVLTQGNRSGSGVFFSRWLRSQGARFERLLTTNSLMAMVGLTVAGLGVSYLPRHCFEPLVQEGKLVVLDAHPALPPVPYALMYRTDSASSFFDTVVDLARTTCNFAIQFQG